jgi:lysophospholipase L1-like esterase
MDAAAMLGTVGRMRSGRTATVHVVTLLLAAVIVVAALLTRGADALADPNVAALSASTPSTATTTPSASPSASAGGEPADHTVVAFGDSVPSGHACQCEPFPQTYGSLLAQRTGGQVAVDNLAVNGLTSAGLLAQLGGHRARAAVRRSDVVLVTIGANDFNDHRSQVVTGRCVRGDGDCVSDELTALRRHLRKVVAVIRSLRGSAPTTLLITGYWNVFEDGDVARHAYGESGLRAALRLTKRANAVIRSVSRAHGARYVDLLAAFQATGKDITTLLAADGDHPNAAGHAVIARALLDAGLPRST